MLRDFGWRERIVAARRGNRIVVAPGGTRAEQDADRERGRPPPPSRCCPSAAHERRTLTGRRGVAEPGGEEGQLAPAELLGPRAPLVGAVDFVVHERGLAVGVGPQRGHERAVRAEEGLIDDLGAAERGGVRVRASRRDVEDERGPVERADELDRVVGPVVRALDRSETRERQPVEVRRHPAGRDEQIGMLGREEHRPVPAVRDTGHRPTVPGGDGAEALVDIRDHRVGHVALALDPSAQVVVPLAVGAVGHHDDGRGLRVVGDASVHRLAEMSHRDRVTRVPAPAVEQVDHRVPLVTLGIAGRQVHADAGGERELAVRRAVDRRGGRV